ncbi:conserved hypothetical protein [Vibrio chagasii]|nr:conserved hypothetical protein [Vibrio chagasii]
MIDILRIILLLGFWVFCLLSSLFLLVHDYLKGGEFVALFFGISFLTLVMHFSKDISELSIGGYIIKLKKVKSDLEKTVAGLETSNINMLKMHIKLLTQVDNSFELVDESSYKDDRIDNFWHVYAIISDLGIEKYLIEDLREALDVLLRGQLFVLCRSQNTLNKEYPKPFTLEQLPLKNDLYKLALKGISDENIAIEVEDKILQGVEEYDKLFQLMEKL